MKVKYFFPTLILSVFMVATPIVSGVIPMVWEVPYTCATIKEAADMAGPNDIILVYDCQTHYITEMVELDQDNVTLRAADGNYPEIVVNTTDPHPYYPRAIWVNSTFNSPDGITIKDLFFNVYKGIPIVISGYSSNTTVENCDFSIRNSDLVKHAIYIGDPDGEQRIIGCTIWGDCSTAESVHYTYCKGVTMMDNDFYNDGVYVHAYGPSGEQPFIGMWNNYFGYIYYNRCIRIARLSRYNPAGGTSTVANNFFWRFYNGIENESDHSYALINSWYNRFYICSGNAHKIISGVGTFYKYGNSYARCSD